MVIPRVDLASRAARCRPVAAVALILVMVLCTAVCSASDVGAASDGSAGDPADRTAGFGPVPAGTYTRPVERAVSDPFHMDAGRYGPGNRGLEYASVVGDVVSAFGSGIVVFAGSVAGRLAVTVLHPDGRRSSLTGLVSLTVARGQTVVRGQLLGRAGQGVHLGLREGERYVDPASFLSQSRRRAVLVPLGELASG